MRNRTTWPREKWQKSTPEEAGLSRRKLALAGQFQAEQATGRPYRITIIRYGKIVADWNFKVDPFRKLNQGLASMSTYACILGIAIDEGIIKSVDDRVIDYYPELIRAIHLSKDPKFDESIDLEVTFRKLITVTSIRMQGKQSTSSIGLYQTYKLNLLTHVVASMYNLYKSTSPSHGGGFGTLTRWKLRDRIGGSWDWRYENTRVSLDEGIFGYFTSFLMTTSDMARCALLWLNKGVWDGESIISSTWMDQITGVKSNIIQSDTFGYDCYGMGFWNNHETEIWPNLPADSFASIGNEHQDIWVCQGLNLIVVHSPGTYNHLITDGARLIELIVESVDD